MRGGGGVGNLKLKKTPLDANFRSLISPPPKIHYVPQPASIFLNYLSGSLSFTPLVNSRTWLLKLVFACACYTVHLNIFFSKH